MIKVYANREALHSDLVKVGITVLGKLPDELHDRNKEVNICAIMAAAATKIETTFIPDKTGGAVIRDPVETVAKLMTAIAVSNLLLKPNVVLETDADDAATVQETFLQETLVKFFEEA